MALLKCIECNNDVSEFAEICPKCGCPVSKTKEEREKLIQNFDDIITCPLCKVKRSKSEIISNNNKCRVCGYDFMTTEDELKKMKEKLSSASTKTTNTPKCPTCGSTNIEKISLNKKAVGAFGFGLFSKTAKSQFHCKDCGYKW